MADTSDVQNALVALCAAVLYPAGAAGQGGWDGGAGWGVGAAYGGAALGTSQAGLVVRVYRGWPVAQQLDPDLAAGIAHLTIYQPNGMGRVGQGYLERDLSIQGAPPTISATVAGNVVTLAGSPTPGNLVGLIVDDVPLVYQVQPGDTLSAIAATLASLIGGETLGTESGAVLTDDSGNPLTIDDPVTVTPVPGGMTLTIGTTRPIVARVGAQGQTIRRPRQQTERYQVTCWSPTPAARDAICSLLDGALSGISWLQLPDQQGRLLWGGTASDDVPSKSALWRRDLFYHVTYWTSHIQISPTILFGVGNVTGGFGQVQTTIS
jgi:hypothetical protein